jgi:hypothetical protein
LNLPVVVAITWCGWNKCNWSYALRYLIKIEGFWYHSSPLNIYEENYVYTENVL